MTLDQRIRPGLLVLASAVGVTAGCDRGPATHPVAGRVEFPGGDVAQLAGHHVEVGRADDPAVRAAGVIEPDGRFRLETLDRGKVLPGAKAGAYQARLVFADEGDGRAKKPKVPPRFLKFETSGLTVQVPPPGDVTLRLSPK